MIFDMTANGVEAANGGLGDDAFTVASTFLQPVYVDGRNGRDRIELGAGFDRAFGGTSDDQIYARDGEDRVARGTGNDKLYGQDGHDRLFGGAGDDYVQGGDDNDRLYGEQSMDALHGESGDDILFGGDRSDQLFGGDHDDRLYGEGGDDVLAGGSGDDRFVFENGFGSDRITDFAIDDERIEFSGPGTPRNITDMRFSDFETMNAPGPLGVYSCLTGFTVSFGSNSLQVSTSRKAYALGADVPFTSAKALEFLDEGVFAFV